MSRRARRKPTRKPTTPPTVGRPPKPDAFDAAINLHCRRAHVAALEAYRAARGLGSVAEAVRHLVESTAEYGRSGPFPL